MKPGGLLKTGGQALGLAGQLLNQRDTKRDLEAAQENLETIRETGVTSTLTPEMSEAMNLAMKNYLDAKNNVQGLTPEQDAKIRGDINRNTTAQITAAGEAGGGQMASYMTALGSANKADSLLDLMAKDATIRLQQEQFASSQLNPVLSTSNAIQGTKERDTDRYNQLLREAGSAVSDLRMQKAKNRSDIFNTSGSAVYNRGQEKQQNTEQFGKLLMNVFAPGSGSLVGGGNNQAPPQSPMFPISNDAGFITDNSK